MLELPRKQISALVHLHMNWIASLKVRLVINNNGRPLSRFASYLSANRWSPILLPFLEKVLEFLMNESQMLISETESFPVCKAFNSCHLVEKDQVIVLDVEVYRV